MSGSGAAVGTIVALDVGTTSVAAVEMLSMASYLAAAPGVAWIQKWIQHCLLDSYECVSS